MNKKLIDLFCITILALVTTIILYLSFKDLNVAKITTTGSQMIELGGPVAAFFIIFYAIFRIYNHIGTSNLEKKLQKLKGTWKVESKSTSTNKKAESETTIKFEEGQLIFGGGEFKEIGKKTNNEIIGRWSVDIAVSDGKSVNYFYTLHDDSDGHNHPWKGIVQMDFAEHPSPTLSGTWQVIGETEYNSGQIIMRKKI
ncbi:hypothetical protein [Halarcobacter anaerophilus]|uniref:Uncharacterized protein n=1 Tax=Halarcobacter anaerophilus TaxID=877500 RepID=A0A4Q0Y0C5_9BACT|nr:hypothetical protein [Halarcobacter anaerophilus]QDF28673.1 putative membrane protein [Halarcobacter anaerophilus]RXJ63392.1 hypothetical protein CRV06_06875 [Halarcobacter anaerophilus]